MSPLFAALVLFAAAAAPAAVPPPRAPVAKPPALGGAMAAGGLISTLRPLGTAPASSGLAAVGDPAPQCRSRCAQARYTCERDSDDCAGPWRQCAERCGGR